MKYFYLLFVGFALFSCNSGLTETGPGQRVFKATLFSGSGNTISANSENERYFTLNNKKYLIAENGTGKFGILSDSRKVILNYEYDKIYNPNLTLVNCIEIRKGNKVGLFNLVTGELLAPRFDYILPEANTPGSQAYGKDGDQLIEINAGDLSTVRPARFSSWPLIQSMSFDLQKIAGGMTYSSYNDLGVVMVPSYIEHLQLMPQNEYWDVATDDSSDFGISSASATTRSERSLSEKIKAFFVSVFEEGIDGREYVLSSEKLVITNDETSSISSVDLHSMNDYDRFCEDASYRFIDNSLIEVRSMSTNVPGYTFARNFSYLRVSEQGEVKPLHSVRKYDFTKFVEIDEDYFRGCFAYYIEDQVDGPNNMYRLSHLTIADLDIMRNEIFAEYGYTFKSEKWQKYFGAQPWYNPRYTDVNDKLTEIDKANISTILKVKASMQEYGEDTFTRKKAIAWHPVG